MRGGIGSAALLLLGVAACGLRPLSSKLDAGAGDGPAAEKPSASEQRAGEVRAVEARLLDGHGPPVCPGPPYSETADSSGGWYTSLAIDPASGELHIVHQVATLQNARHAFGRIGSWQSEALTSDGSGGQSSALAAEAGGRLHLTYFDTKLYKQVYRERAPGGAFGAVLPFDGTFGGGNDLTVDGRGDLHWVTYAKFATEVQYRRRGQAGWSSPVTVETKGAASGPKCGVGLSPNGGTVWISLTTAAGDLKLCKLQSGALQGCEVLDSGLGGYSATDLAVDGNGDVHIVYFDSTSREQRLASQKGGSFGPMEKLDFVGGTVVMENAIASTAGGDLWIAYFNAQPGGGLELVRRKQGVLDKPVILEAGGAGRYVSLALGPAGEAHLSHLALTTQQLRHTRVCP